EIIVTERADDPALSNLIVAAAANGAKPAPPPCPDFREPVKRSRVLIPHAVTAAALNVAARPVVDGHSRRRLCHRPRHIRGQRWTSKQSRDRGRTNQQFPHGRSPGSFVWLCAKIPHAIRFGCYPRATNLEKPWRQRNLCFILM